MSNAPKNILMSQRGEEYNQASTMIVHSLDFSVLATYTQIQKPCNMLGVFFNSKRKNVFQSLLPMACVIQLKLSASCYLSFPSQQGIMQCYFDTGLSYPSWNDQTPIKTAQVQHSFPSQAINLLTVTVCEALRTSREKLQGQDCKTHVVGRYDLGL